MKEKLKKNDIDNELLEAVEKVIEETPKDFVQKMLIGSLCELFLTHPERYTIKKIQELIKKEKDADVDTKVIKKVLAQGKKDNLFITVDNKWMLSPEGFLVGAHYHTVLNSDDNTTEEALH
jgi:high-affinity nickel permease